MRRIIALNGSPRRNGNTTLLLHELLSGAGEAGAHTEEIVTEALNVKYCRGCLRCNLLRRCAVRGDDWNDLCSKILMADTVVFASPVYFYHVSASLKKVLERFRSFMHVRITGAGLEHTPWQNWSKTFVVLLCQGSPDEADARHIRELFTFITESLGPGNRLHTIIGTGLAVPGQVAMPLAALRALYGRMNLPGSAAESDYARNQKLMRRCFRLGHALGGNRNSDS